MEFLGITSRLQLIDATGSPNFAQGACSCFMIDVFSSISFCFEGAFHATDAAFVLFDIEDRKSFQG